MSFGFGIGDFLAIAKLVKGVRGRFVDAPSQYSALVNELKSLSIVLEDAEVVVSQRNLTDKQCCNLTEIFNGCKGVLTELNERLNKFQELGLQSQNPHSSLLTIKARQSWQRLKWDPKDVADLRGRLLSNVNLLQAFTVQLTRQSSARTQDVVDRLNIRQEIRDDEKQKETISTWLSSSNVSTQHNSFIRRRHPGTGLWLLASDEFQQWLAPDDPKQILFCPGIPGAGKTIMTAIVIDNLLNKFSSDPNVAIVYIYFDFRRQEEQKPEELLASLLKQLIQWRPQLHDSTATFYECHKMKHTRPNYIELSEELRKLISTFSRVFIALDALDECQDSIEHRDIFISEILDIRKATNACLFATSRHIPEITRDFEGELCKEIRASDEDILRYVDGRMLHLLRKRISRYPELQSMIRDKVLAAADGMFLLAELHMNSLMDKPTIGDLKGAVRALPHGEAGLDTTYEQAMGRIDCQQAEYRSLAIQVLSWVTHAMRPLSGMELQHALGVRPGMLEFDPDFLPELEDLVSSCAGLITFDKQSDVVRLVHYTTQTFFEKTSKSWFPEAQTKITGVCINYMSFKSFEIGFSDSFPDFEARMKLQVLYGYATSHWGNHARKAPQDQVEQMIHGFLNCEQKVATASQALLGKKDVVMFDNLESLSSPAHGSLVNGLRFRLSAPKYTGPLHLAAYFGLTFIINGLLESGCDVNVRNSECRTPLFYAANSGCNEAVAVLLACKDIEVDPKDVYDCTPFLCAIRNSDEDMIRNILAAGSVDVNFYDNEGNRPLTYAIQAGVHSIIKLILDLDDVELDYTVGDRKGPLVQAVEAGSFEAFKLLIATGKLNLGACDFRHGSPLVAAVHYNRPEIVDFLLSAGGIDLNATSSTGSTALSEAAFQGSIDIIAELLRAGADPDFVDSRYGKETPLMKAIRGNEGQAVRILLDTGNIDVNYQKLDTDNIPRSDTPLTIAVRIGEVSIVKLLLAVDGIDLNIKDEDGKAPLSLAISTGNAEELVRLLLETEKAEVNTQDMNGRTPLTCVFQKKEQIIKEYREDENPSPTRTRIYEEALKSCDNIINMLKELGARSPSQRSINLFRAAVALHKPLPWLCVRHPGRVAPCEEIYQDVMALFKSEL